jgi:hypothetical protein
MSDEKIDIPEAVIDPEITIEQAIRIIRSNLWCHTLDIWRLRSAEAKLITEYEKLHDAHKELLSYIPKVPTEPYEKRLTKRCNELLSVLEDSKKALQFYKESGEHFGSNDGGATARSAIDKIKKLQGELV